MPVSSSPRLSTLPEELLYDILRHIPTKELLQINTTSPRINDTVRSVLVQRLRSFQELGSYTFVFGCSTPARRNLTPYQKCLCVGYSVTPTQDTRDPSSIYSVFSPGVRSDDSGASTAAATTVMPMSTHCFLDEGQGFIQLCANSILVKFGPSGSLYSALARVSDETAFRLRRRELNRQESHVLCLDDRKNVALRVRPTVALRQPWVDAPGVREEDGGEGPCEYDVTYEEVLVRSTYLLSVLEEGMGKCQQNGIIIGRR